ncbi:unnamed protein product, partial [marine sediment metagenome]
KLKKTNRKIDIVQIAGSKHQNQFNGNDNSVIFDTL